MPACFQLFPKGSNEPARFSDIDNAMREHFGAEPDDKHYYESWYDIEGFSCALGLTWENMKERKPERAAIIDYLSERYVCSAWAEIGRR